MNAPEILSEIRDLNLNYLFLAQQLLRADRESAMFRLGMNNDIAAIIENLSMSQITKLAQSNMCLVSLRFNDAAVLSMLTSYSKEKSLLNAQTNLLMAALPTEI